MISLLVRNHTAAMIRVRGRGTKSVWAIRTDTYHQSVLVIDEQVCTYVCSPVVHERCFADQTCRFVILFWLEKKKPLCWTAVGPFARRVDHIPLLTASTRCCLLRDNSCFGKRTHIDWAVVLSLCWKTPQPPLVLFAPLLSNPDTYRTPAFNRRLDATRWLWRSTTTNTN